MTTLATLQSRLAEAETALHELLTGRRTVSVDYDGRKVQFTMTKVDDLRSYIADLKTQIAALDPAAPRSRRHRRITFG